MPVSTNLVAYYSLEETSGTRNDSKGTNHLTDHNNVGSAAGKVGTAADLEFSSSQYLNVSDSTDLSMGDIDFSLTAWVNLESVGASRVIVSKSDSGGAGNVEYMLMYNLGGDKFQFYVSSGSGLANFTNVPATTLGSPSLATWYFIVVRHDAAADTISIQVNNGTIDSTAYTFGSYDSGVSFAIGAWGDGPESFDGLIDEVGVWKKVLTTDESTWLYNSGNGRSYSDIVAEGGGGATLTVGIAEPTIGSSLF